MTLEKSSTLAQSGSPISASRDLNVVFGPTKVTNFTEQQVPTATTAAGPPDIAVVKWGQFYVEVFVPYVCLVTVFLDSVLTRS